jgi:phospholipid transport system substrate-binding protein
MKRYDMQAQYPQRKKKISFSWLSILKGLLLTATLFLLVFSYENSVASEENPMQPIQETVEKILDILRSNTESEWVVTRGKISAIIQNRFDFQEQSRLVLANAWAERSAEEKEHFISLFSTLQEHVYLNRLRDYSGETVQFTKQVTKKGKALVFSAIIKDQEEIPIVYRMKKKEGTWLVYDVIIDGVSLVKNYRKQFASILEKESYTDLISQMEEKVKKVTADEENTKAQ